MRMPALKLSVLAATAVALLAGCAGNQSRTAYQTDRLQGSDIERETYLHGSAGYTIAEIFYTGDVAAARGDFDGDNYGLQLSEFYMVEIAPNPLEPTQVVQAGFVRKMVEDRGSLFYFEFYNQDWKRLGYLNASGDLYLHYTGIEQNVGKFQLMEAVRYLFPAESGYGYDTVLQDASRVRSWDPEVATRDSRGRGVEHRTHKSHPAIIELKLYRAGEAGALAESRYSSNQFKEAEEARLTRLREARHGGIGQDEEFGGFKYKDGQPVDEYGNPITKRR